MTWLLRWLGTTRRELRYALRSLRRAPAFAVTVVLTVALAVGLNTAAFTVYDAVALRPLPVRTPREWVRVSTIERGQRAAQLSWGAYALLRRDARLLRDVVATSGPQSVVAVLPGARAADARVLALRLVSDDYFAALGVAPAAGHAPARGEAGVVLSDAFWARALGRDPAVVGKTLAVGGAYLPIVGIMPAAFVGTGAPPTAPDVWAPAALQRTLLPDVDWLDDPAQRQWEVLARLAPHVAPAQATASLVPLARALPVASVTTPGTPGSAVANVRLDARLDVRPATLFQTDSGEFEAFGLAGAVLLAAMGVLAVLGCLNLTNLLSARHAAREREIATRLALGAGRGRVVWQLCGEVVLLSAVGGALGLALSRGACAWLRAWVARTSAEFSTTGVGFAVDLAPSWHVVAYAAALALLVGVAVGLWPARRAGRADVSAVLRQGTTSTDARHLWRRRHALLAVQVAGSVVLLTAAGLLFGGVRRAGAVDPGFAADRLLVVGIDATTLAQTPARRAALLEAVVRRLEPLPDVAGVAWAAHAPYLGHHMQSFVDERGAHLTYTMNDVSAGWFATLGVPLVAGRGFTAQEVAERRPVMVVSEAVARRYFPGGNALGRTVARTPWLAAPDARAYTVVGVARDVRGTFLSKPDAGMEYFPQRLDDEGSTLLVRTRRAPADAARAVLVALAGVDRALPARTRVLPVSAGPMALQRLMVAAPATAAGTLALLGLVLAAVGIHGVVAQLVARRTREIGIHVALGARPAQVVALVLRQTLRPVVWGAALGGAGALAVAAGFAHLLTMPDAPDFSYGAGAFDPATFGTVLGTLTFAVLSAALGPARRALGVAPVTALRSD